MEGNGRWSVTQIYDQESDGGVVAVESESCECHAKVSGVDGVEICISA